ncbi:hypothetical protein Ahy_A10g051109 [Arachis hypogaea]|uniref:CCHC-type domain-containing protein n=1 Tax=Arachis hypogaea TaxID=3818 RepID=A0A445BBK8_ARAHY|nr:hypothetical protein Ahy_A10g051109 [Arachis hypogaea]
MKASKPNVNVTRGSKAKTQGKKAGYKKDDCAVSGGNGPEVRKKGDGGSRAVGPDSVEPSPADNNGPNEVNGNDPRKPSTFTEEIGVEPRDDNPGSEAVGDKEQKASKPGSEAVGDKEQNASKPGSEAVSDKAQHEKNECPWIIYCARNSRSGGYQIKTFNHVHTCGREFGSNMADQNWVAEKLAKRLLSIPCVHAMAAIGRRGDRPEGYVHQWLKMDAFRATYAHSISPVNSEEYWDKSGVVSSIPLKIKRPIGRPVKRRRPDVVEDSPDGTKTKKTFRVTCSKCGDIGHNAKTCKGAPQQGSSSKAKGKKKQVQPQHEMVVSQSAPLSQAQQPFRRPKQTIRRPQVQGSLDADMTAATTSPAASEMFKFIPTPGLNQSKKK